MSSKAFTKPIPAKIIIIIKTQLEKKETKGKNIKVTWKRFLVFTVGVMKLQLFERHNDIRSPKPFSTCG